MQNTFRWTIRSRRYATLAVGLACLFVAVFVTVPAAQSATLWTKTTTAGGPWYWYDDYTAPDGTVESPFNTVTPPGNPAGNANSNWNDGHRSTDYHISNGYDSAGEGVVFDPDTDPFKTGQPSVGSVGLGSGASPTAYGTGAGQVILSDPFYGVTRLYLTTTHDTAVQPNNKLTLKSGTLVVGQQIRVTRFNAGATSATGTIVQHKGATLIVEPTLGQYITLGDGDLNPASPGTPTTMHGIYDYRGGTLEVGVSNSISTGIRMGSPNASPVGANDKNFRRRGTFIVNPDDVDAGNGHIRAQTYQSGVTNNGDGTSTNIAYTLATSEFHYQNAGSGWDGTRAVQVLGDLSIRNTGDPAPPSGYPGTANPDYGDLTIGSSRLDVVLDEAPTVSGNQGGYKIPINLALFDVDHGDGTNTNDIVEDGGSQGPDQFYSSTSLFSLPADHLTDADAEATDDGVDLVAGLLEGGDLVSATIGGETYSWKIYYSGNITWSNADNSTIANPGFGLSGDGFGNGVGQITGSGTGKDVVLIGWKSTIEADVVASTTGDFDDDGDQDAADIDILWHIIRGTGADPNPGGGVGVLSDTADLNGDTFANEDDVDLMLASKLTAGTNRAYGDANLTGGTPELTDFNLWRTGTGGWAQGDFDGSGGTPELTDFNLWRTGPTVFPTTVGSHGGGGAPLVPEPATLVLMGLGLPVLVLVARRRKAT